MPTYGYISDVSADTPLVTTAETVVATLSNVANGGVGRPVTLSGNVVVTTGTTTSALVLRVREDSLTGTVVDEAETDTLAAAAGGTEDHAVVAVHSPSGELSGKTYVLTVAQSGATGNGSCVHATLRAAVER